MMFFQRRGRVAQRRALIERLHEDIVQAALRPGFYRECAVPDTFFGRFEMLVLHGGMVVRRLQQAEAPGPQIAQDLIDRIFYGLDADLRELGVGDTVVPKRMKKLAEAFLGRSAAYQAALAEPIDGDHAGTALEIAIARNVYDGAAAGPRLVAYVRTLHQALAAASLDVCLAAPLPFPEIEVP